MLYHTPKIVSSTNCICRSNYHKLPIF